LDISSKERLRIGFRGFGFDCLERVGLKYPNPRFTKDKEWYTKRTWTEKEQESFKEFVKKKVRKAFPYLNENQVDFEAGMFILSYGWKTE